ncbi:MULTISPECIES: nuclear transport factor 2 family protein [Bacillaceae]|uniref:nuclear transport factor 2 family protein n=1 Tax=Bacillaceae TaxID=186817 RepID=UPI000BFB3F7D|nr:MULTISPECIES: nuclear transport factor 2 family protein [Bacillaceae]PGT84133.1 hypothetical protein COD11_11330 [Bacillus sp. AFS040349]UGB33568.1 nuclear transport factor 2 family protein [Metabacillus sp. B2-18]
MNQRIQQLEDIEAIWKIQATYGHYVDKGWYCKEIYFKELSSLFTEDATWESSNEIVEMLKESTATVELGMHSFTNRLLI